MTRFLLTLALQRARAEWRLLLGLLFGTVVGVALLASAPIYLRALDDLGLQSTLRREDASALDIHVSASSLRAGGPEYTEANQRALAGVGGAMSAYTQGSLRYVRSATFYITPPGQAPRTDDARPRGHFQAVSDLEEHADLVEGNWLTRPANGQYGADVVEVLVSEDVAGRLGVALGDEFGLEAFWLNEPVTLRARVAGIVRPRDPAERFWSGEDYFTMPAGEWDTYPFFVREDALFDQIAQYVEGVRVDATWAFLVDGSKLDGGNASEALEAVIGARNAVQQRIPGATFSSKLEPVLSSFESRLLFARVPLFILIFQVELIVLFYVVIVSAMVVERQSSEIAVFKSRGAGQRQMLVIYLLQAVLIALIALTIGPPLAAIGVALLGLTPTFSDLSEGSLLTVHLSRNAYLLGLAGAALSVVALLIPAFRASRISIVQHRQAAARQSAGTGFKRYYIDIVLILAGAFLFWRIQQQSLVTVNRSGEQSSDPLLLLAPALFSVTAALIFLRLFPLVLALLGRMIAPWRSTSALLALQYMVRAPSHYGRLIFLLILATSLGLFAASFGATLQRSYDDRARYEVGSDIRFDFAAAAPTRDITSVAATAGRSGGAESATPVIRLPGSLARSQRDSSLTVLAVDPATFAGAAWFRPDFADASIEDLVGRLKSERTAAGMPLPESAREFGVWVRIPDPVPGLFILARALDSNGQYFDYVLGVTSTDPPVFAQDKTQRGLALWGSNGLPVAVGDQLAGWNYLTANIVDPLEPSIARGVGRRTFETHQRPVQLVSLYFEQRLDPDQAPGATLLLDDISITDDQGATQVVDGFEQPGTWEAVPADASTDAPDTFDIVSDGPHEGAFVAQYTWATASVLDQVHGIRYTTPGGGAMPVLANTALLERVNRVVGDTLRISVGTHEFDVRVVGDFELFPTFRSEDGDFIVADLAQTRTELNRVPGSGGVRSVNEVWVRTITTVSPESINLPSGSRPSTVLSAAEVRESFRLDPLIETGWQGVLLIAFLTIAVLSSLGTLIYSYLAAQARRLDFAVLRTMGLSSNQIFGLVGFEQILVVGIGILAGTIIGSRLGVLLLASLELTETGERVTPPYVMEINWFAAGIAYGVIAFAFVCSVLFLVLFFSRLSLHRMLRIGEA